LVIFFTRPEVLSALLTLANFDQADPDGVTCPLVQGARPSSIIRGSGSRGITLGQYWGCLIRRPVPAFRSIS
jgi:hypothetical protein